MLTDRDICLAINDDGRLPEMRVGQIANRPTFRCAEDDDVGDALAVMSDHQVRRLPVVDRRGRLQGILSMNDVVLAARQHPELDGAPSYDQVVQTMRRICEHRTFSPVAVPLA